MKIRSDLDPFLTPRSVAVIGATDRQDTWGFFIMRSLVSSSYSGAVYPVNRRADQILGLPAYKDVRDIKGPVDLAVLTVPDEFVEETLAACGQKEVKGITIITAGFAETSESGREQQERLAALARSHGIRLLGPNVSGTFDLHAGFNGSPRSAGETLLPTPIAAACQGGFAFYDLLTSGWARGMGVGKFVHTGNECDLTVTDFVERFGDDPEVKAIVMYIEAIRDGRRFTEVVRAVTQRKPVVVYKGGRTSGSARAARSHTGALAGKKEIYNGVFRQLGVTLCPVMELLLPVAHALIERPPIRGPRVAIITMGGSWGVALSDALEEAGLCVPELSHELQKTLRSMGMPPRASTRNPVDYGASGLFISVDILLALAREILSSGEVDTLMVHGIGWAGMHTEDTPDDVRFFADIQRQQIRGLNRLEKETGLPVLIGSHYSLWESQVVWDLNKEGIRIYDRLSETVGLLSLVYDYWKERVG
jgi:acyl-CoA synthetase (NDP forming)